MGRVLALDYGEKRLGLALSDPLAIIAQPAGYLRTKILGDNLELLATLCHDRQVVQIVIGLPKNMDGGEGESAERARCFGDQVEKCLKLPVEYVDERLTTAAADRVLLERNVAPGVTQVENDIDDGFVMAPDGKWLGIDGESTALGLNYAGAKCVLAGIVNAAG